MMRVALIFAFILCVCTVLYGQRSFERLIVEKEIPQVVVDSLKYNLPDISLDKAVKNVGVVDKEDKRTFKFYLDFLGEKNDLAQIYIRQNGRIASKMYRIDKSGDIPIEVLMAMQEECTEKKITKLWKTVFPKGKVIYQAMCGDMRFKFDGSAKLIGSSTKED